MKLQMSGDSLTVETDSRDADLAAAARDTIRGLTAFADALGLGNDGTCDNCGDEASLGPVAASVDGEPARLMVCRDCQDTLVDQRLAAEVGAFELEDPPDDHAVCSECGDTHDDGACWDEDDHNAGPP